MIETFHSTMGADGRVILPARCRHALGLRPGDRVVIESDGDTLLVRGGERLLADVQAAFAGCRVPGAGAVDELIADRRAAARAEAAGGC